MTDNGFNVAMGFVAGFNCGLVLAAALLFFKVRKAILELYQQEKPKVEKPATTEQTPLSSEESVLERLGRASELTRLQNEIMQQAQQPSQNSLHSKHKNGLIQQYKTLETEKMNILHSIVKEGHDPLVTVFNAASNQNEEVKLSFFLNQFQPEKTKDHTDTNLPLEGEGIRKIEKQGKTFYVIDGGKKTTQ